MIKTNKKKEILSIVFCFILALFASSFLSETLNFIIGGKFSMENVKYYSLNLHMAVFGVPLLLILFLKNMIFLDQDVTFYIFGISTILIILLICFGIFYTSKKILNNQFMFSSLKYSNYFWLSILFELWFLIGLLIPVMAKL